MNPPEPMIRKLVGIYNAEGSMRGELTYLLAKAMGRDHCALCDITHNWLRRSREFQRVVRDLPVPFDFVHSDNRSGEVRAASQGVVPCVLAQTNERLVLLLGPEEIASCAGVPAALVDAVRRAAEDRALRWPVSA